MLNNSNLISFASAKPIELVFKRNPFPELETGGLKTAQKNFVTATKIRLKASNHYFNATNPNPIKISNNPDYIAEQILRAKVRIDSIFKYLANINDTFEKAPELKKQKGKVLWELSRDFETEINKLSEKIQTFIKERKLEKRKVYITITGTNQLDKIA